MSKLALTGLYIFGAFLMLFGAASATNLISGALGTLAQIVGPLGGVVICYGMLMWWLGLVAKTRRERGNLPNP